MIVYCNNTECLHYQDSGEAHFVGEDQKGVTPFEADAYKGICTCEKLFVRSRKVVTRTLDLQVPECVNFSDKKYKGRMDFSRFPQGGNIG